MKDSTISSLIKREEKRQQEFVELIASENFCSESVREASGSLLTNKYAEGYPKKRYYGGCEIVDEVEQLAIDRAKKIFNAKFANVQPHSGTQANFAAYLALIKPGDKILGMSLDSGGHLTHGHFVSASGIIFKSSQYKVNKKTHKLDYEEIQKIATKEKPKLIICGASAYSREINFKKFREIADSVDAYLLADVAHIAGLIVANLHQSPMEYCDVVTSTTHKTLRGPRGGVILTNNEEIANKINKSVFPMNQGGPMMQTIAAKAIAFKEASSKSFIDYQNKVVANSKALADFFIKNNISVITNGTDNHLFLIDVKKSFNLSGEKAERLLYLANIIVNKNTIPYDTNTPLVASGIRIGTPAMTTKGFEKDDFLFLGDIIIKILNKNSEKFARKYKKDILNLLKGKSK